MSKAITPNLYPKFFTMMRKATLALGITSKDAVDAYYKRVLDEAAHCSSVKQLPSLAAFEACLTRFATDAGDFTAAADPEVEKQKRRAYVVKVMCCQIMQLKGLDDSTARAYFDGVLHQARPSCGHYSDGSKFYLDLTSGSLLLALQILDSHLRKLKRQLFPTFPLSFNDRIRYVKCGDVYTIEDVPKWHYHNHPFQVRF